MAISLLHWAPNDPRLHRHAVDLITDPTKIALLLQQLFGERINIKISVAGTKLKINCSVFELDRKNLLFKLNAQMPNCGHDILAKQKFLSIECQGQGPMISFTANLLKAEISGGAQIYKLQFPKAIKYTERRGMFRAKLNFAKKLDFSCLHAGSLLSGYVHDISGSGMAIVLNNAGALNVDNTLEYCCFILPNEVRLTLELEICNFKKLADTQIRLGCKFRNLNAQQKKIIGMFVRALERNSSAKRR